MTFPNGYGASNNPNYCFIGPSKNGGLWGIYYPRRDNGFDHEKWELKEEIRKAQQKKEREQQSKLALSTEEMDKAIRKLHRYIGLTSSDRQNLQDRGLTDEQIEAGLFFSVSPNQEIPSGIPLNFPGIHWSGKKLTCNHAGIACVAFDKDGKAIGYQIRLNKAERNKYRWAKGKTSSHLRNRELPLTITGPSLTKAEIVWLLEGILKPFIASQKWGITCIGASGGNHTSSKEQLKAALELLPDDCLIAIMPDAGAIFNDNVLRQHKVIIQLLTDWGYQDRLRIGWYDQILKTDKDCDEIDLDTFNRIKYIDPKTYFDIAQKQQQKQQYWDAWKQSKQFTPDIITKTRYFSYSMGKSPNTIELLKGGLGSGKTTKLRKQLLKNWKNKGIISLGYRNLLLIQFGEHEQLGDCKFAHIHEDSKDVYFADKQLWLSACVDSILKIPLEAFDGKLLILDEVVSIIKHLLFSSTVRQRPLVIKHFFEAIKRCDRVIALDGNMADWVATFFENIDSSKKIVKVENQYEIPKAPITILKGTIGDDDILRPNDRSPLIRQVLNEEEKFAICTDSQIFLESLDIELRRQGKKTLRIDSKTVGDKTLNITAILKGDINKWLKENDIDVLLYSPSAESGLDIDIKNYFKSHYVFLFGVIDIDSSLQKLLRIRDTQCKKYIWCRSYSIVDEPADSKSYDAEILAWYQNQSLTRDLHSAMSGEVDGLEMISNILKMIQESHGPDSKTANQLQAIRNFERANFRQCLIEALTMKGYSFDQVTFDRNDPDNFAAKEQLKAATNEVKDQNAHDIFTASDRFIGRANTTLRFDADWPTRCALKKARWIDRLPGIEQTEAWTESFIRLIEYDKPNLVSGLERYYLAQNLDKAKLLSIDKYKRLNERAIAGKTVCGWQLKTEYSMVKALADIDILKLLDCLDERFTVDHPLIKSIISKAKAKPIQHALKKKVGKDPMKFIGNLIRALGGDWKRVTKKVKGKSIHYYRVISPTSDPITHEILLAIERKVEREILKNNADFSQKNNCQKNNFLSPENQSENDFEQVPLSTNFFIKNTPQVEPLNDNDSFNSINTETDSMATANDPFVNYHVGDRYWLWHPFNQKWQPATIKQVINGLNGYLYVLGDNGMGNHITRYQLNHIVPLVD